MRNRIKTIIVEEFARLTHAIEDDFQKNYKKKVNNFLLSQMDAQITANMVFVSSFESKSGNAIEACAKRIARLTFGEDSVPAIVNPHNLTHNIDPASVRGQIIVTPVDMSNGTLHGEITKFRVDNVATGRGRSRVECQTTHQSIQTKLLPLSQKYMSNSIHQKPVDLAFFDGTTWNIMELKAGGDLDSSNAPSNVDKLLTIYVGMGIENCRAYFATLYNKDGEGNTWKGAIKQHLHYPSMFLIGTRFWERILPPEISFSEFTVLYREALQEIDLNKHIRNMISSCIGEC